MIKQREKQYHIEQNNMKITQKDYKSKQEYRKLSDEEKNVKRKYGRNRYHNISKENKQRIKEYQKKLS